LEKKPKQDLVVQLRAMLASATKIAVDLKGANAGEQDLSVRLKLNDNRDLVVERKITVPAGAAPAPAPAATPTPAPTPALAPSPVPVPYKAPKWLWPTVIGGSALLLGLLAALIVRMTRSKPEIPPVETWPDTNPANPWPTDGNGTVDKQEDTFHDESVSPIEPETQFVIGWLEQIDKAGSRGPRHAIIKSKLNIGRSSDSDLRFEDESVSIHHATIHRRSDRTLAITDLHSSNGIYVNAKRVEHCVLRDQDIIEIGEIRLKLSLNETHN
jgi:hypothetical protein